MSEMPDRDLILAAWLDDGPTALPSSTRRAIVAAVPTTRQARRGLLAPGRFGPMNISGRAAAAAVFVIVVAAIALVGPRLGGVGNGPSPSPSPTVPVTTQPTPTPGAVASPAQTPPSYGFVVDSLVFDRDGNLYGSDCSAGRIVRLNDAGGATVVVGSGPGGFSGGSSGDGGPATAARISCPHATAFDSAGTMYVTDHNSNLIRRVDEAGIISAFAGGGTGGDGGPATSAQIDRPVGIAVDAAGNVYFSGYDNRIRKVDTNGVITTLAGTGAAGFAGDGGPASSALLDGPAGLAFDPQGNLYVADSNNNRIRRIDPSGTITTVAGTGASGEDGDGGPATAATLADPESVAFDAAGNLYVGDAVGNRVRRISTEGVISAFAGTGAEGYAGDGGPGSAALLSATGSAVGLAIDSDGNVYIADPGNHCIRVVAPNGIISTFGLG